MAEGQRTKRREGARRKHIWKLASTCGLTAPLLFFAVVLWRPGRESYVMELAEAVKREEEAGSEVVRVEQCAAGGEEGGGGGQTFEGRSSGGRSHGQGRGGSRRSLARNSKGPVL